MSAKEILSFSESIVCSRAVFIWCEKDTMVDRSTLVRAEHILISRGLSPPIKSYKIQ